MQIVMPQLSEQA